MNIETVRALALSLPEAEEQDHQGRPSFRIRKKIFATLWPDEQRVVVKLDRADQNVFTTFAPHIFSAVPGTWGVHGWTSISLRTVEPDDLERALRAAWARVAPKRLRDSHHQK